MGAIAREQRMRRDRDRDECVADRPRPGQALPFEADLLSIGEARRNLDVHLLAVRQMHAARAAFRGLGERDGHRHRDVATAGRRAEIIRFELRIEARAPARAAAEHALEDILEAAESARAAAPPPETSAARKDRFEIFRLAEAAGARLLAEALEALKTRLALGVDLTAIERLALRIVAQDFIGGIELAEALRRLRIVLVGVRMQFLGEPPIGALDGRSIR